MPISPSKRPPEPASLAAAPTSGVRVETRAQIVDLDSQGILRARSKARTDLTLEDAKEVIVKIVAAYGDQRRPILVDFAGMGAMSRDARQYFAGPETAKVESAAALLVVSPLSKAIGNFFMGLNKPLIPTRLFNSETEAIKWLQGFLR